MISLHRSDVEKVFFFPSQMTSGINGMGSIGMYRNRDSAADRSPVACSLHVPFGRIFINALQQWSGSWIDFEYNVMPLHNASYANHQRTTVHRMVMVTLYQR